MKKILTIILCFNLLGIFNACECPPERYFDYSSIAMVAHNPHVAINDELTLYSSYIDMYYLTQANFISTFATSAFAMSRCEKGYDGEKYPKSKVSITSNSDFNEQYPAGADLSPIIKTFGTDSNGVRSQKYINEFQPQEIELGFMNIDLRPNNDNSHILTITVEKSNGEILSAVSQEIIWE